MTKLLLAALLGLSTGALLHTSPRQLADTAEHALGWVCRMTYNDSGGGEQTRDVQSQQAVSIGTKGPSRQNGLDTQGAVTTRSAVTFSNDSGSHRLGLSSPCVGIRKSREQSRPAVTFFLRMLGLPRLRTTPPELRPL